MVEIKLFKAPWCGQCHVMENKFKNLESKYPNIKFNYIDVDQEEQLTKDYDIMGLPTIVIEKDKNELHRFIGIKTDKDLESILNKL